MQNELRNQEMAVSAKQKGTKKIPLSTVKAKISYDFPLVLVQKQAQKRLLPSPTSYQITITYINFLEISESPCSPNKPEEANNNTANAAKK